MVWPAPAKTRRIEICVTDTEHAFEEAAAQAFGVSLREFFRRAARASAEEVLAERSSITLNDGEAACFLDALDHPGRFEAGLRASPSAHRFPCDELRLVEPLYPRRDQVVDFDRGEPNLDRWLRACAGHSLTSLSRATGA